MSRLSLIIGREYLSTVGKKSFILMTILMPVLMLALCLVLPLMLSSVKSDEKKVVAVVDHSGIYASHLQNEDEFVFQVTPPSATGVSLTDEGGLYNYYSEQSSDIYAIVTIPESLLQSAQVRVYSDHTIAGGLERIITRQLEPILRKQKIEEYGIPELENIIAECNVDLSVKTVKWDEQGTENESWTGFAQFIGILLSMLTYTFVMIYGAMIMNGVIEEKTNRIVEVIVSSCKPVELMLGKIIGVALVGLTQIAIWAVLGTLVTTIGASFIGASSPEMATAASAVSEVSESGMMQEILQMLATIDFTQIFFCFLLYFIGGYLLYAALFAAFGSAVDQPNDASQFTMPIMMIMIFSLYTALYSMDNPDGPLSFWCSFIPFTSPMVMMVRLPYDVPTWQLVASIGTLYLTAYIILLLSARIYRTGILMYGKKTTFKEILKWLK